METDYEDKTKQTFHSTLQSVTQVQYDQALKDVSLKSWKEVGLDVKL